MKKAKLQKVNRSKSPQNIKISLKRSKSKLKKVNNQSVKNFTGNRQLGVQCTDLNGNRNGIYDRNIIQSQPILKKEIPQYAQGGWGNGLSQVSTQFTQDHLCKLNNNSSQNINQEPSSTSVLLYNHLNNTNRASMNSNNNSFGVSHGISNLIKKNNSQTSVNNLFRSHEGGTGRDSSSFGIPSLVHVKQQIEFSGQQNKLQGRNSIPVAQPGLNVANFDKRQDGRHDSTVYSEKTQAHSFKTSSATSQRHQIKEGTGKLSIDSNTKHNNVQFRPASTTSDYSNLTNLQNKCFSINIPQSYYSNAGAGGQPEYITKYVNPEKEPNVDTSSFFRAATPKQGPNHKRSRSRSSNLMERVRKSSKAMEKLRKSQKSFITANIESVKALQKVKMPEVPKFVAKPAAKKNENARSKSNKARRCRSKIGSKSRSKSRPKSTKKQRKSGSRVFRKNKEKIGCSELVNKEINGSIIYKDRSRSRVISNGLGPNHLYLSHPVENARHQSLSSLSFKGDSVQAYPSASMQRGSGQYNATQAAPYGIREGFVATYFQDAESSQSSLGLGNYQQAEDRNLLGNLIPQPFHPYEASDSRTRRGGRAISRGSSAPGSRHSQSFDTKVILRHHPCGCKKKEVPFTGHTSNLASPASHYQKYATQQAQSPKHSGLKQCRTYQFSPKSIPSYQMRSNESTLKKKKRKSVSKRKKSSQGRKTVRHSKSRTKSGPKRNNFDMRTSPWCGEQTNQIQSLIYSPSDADTQYQNDNQLPTRVWPIQAGVAPTAQMTTLHSLSQKINSDSDSDNARTYLTFHKPKEGCVKLIDPDLVHEEAQKMKVRQENRFATLKEQMAQSLQGVQDAKKRMNDEKENKIDLKEQVQVFSEKIERLQAQEEERQIERLKDKLLREDIQARREQRENKWAAQQQTYQQQQSTPLINYEGWGGDLMYQSHSLPAHRHLSFGNDVMANQSSKRSHRLSPKRRLRSLGSNQSRKSLSVISESGKASKAHSRRNSSQRRQKPALSTHSRKSKKSMQTLQRKSRQALLRSISLGKKSNNKNTLDQLKQYVNSLERVCSRKSLLTRKSANSIKSRKSNAASFKQKSFHKSQKSNTRSIMSRGSKKSKISQKSEKSKFSGKKSTSLKRAKSNKMRSNKSTLKNQNHVGQGQIGSGSRKSSKMRKSSVKRIASNALSMNFQQCSPQRMTPVHIKTDESVILEQNYQYGNIEPLLGSNLKNRNSGLQLIFSSNKDTPAHASSKRRQPSSSSDDSDSFIEFSNRRSTGRIGISSGKQARYTQQNNIAMHIRA